MSNKIGRNLTMLLDLYEMTMANGILTSDMKDTVAYFDMFFRRVPDEGGFAIMAGLEQLIEYFNSLSFSDEDIEYLKSLNLFSQEFLDYLRFIDCYSTDLEYRIYNNKGVFSEKATLLYHKAKGYRLSLDSNRIYTYKENKILVQDLENGKSYELKSTFDEFYKWAFLKSFIELMYTNEEMEKYSMEKEGKIYLFVELYIPQGNENLDKGILMINTESRAPEKLSIYDYKGELKAEIIYSNFQFQKDLDEALFNY